MTQERGCVVTIGAFDGVHLGHRALVQQVKDEAVRLDCASAVVTFDRHPAAVVRPESAPGLLTDLDQKLELLHATGIDYTFVVPFDAIRAAEEALHFVDEVLVKRLRARAVIVGYDFHFGKGRHGNYQLLSQRGAEAGFTVAEAKALEVDGEVVSSTRIRTALDDGNVAAATRLLGRPHEVRGLVVMGDGRGRELGYPTANVSIGSDIKLPSDGVYAGEYVFPDGTARASAISVGTRPTFYDNGVRLVEAFVLDFDGDLYGQHASVRFLHHLRPQQNYDSLDELMTQLRADVDETRRSVGS